VEAASRYSADSPNARLVMAGKPTYGRFPEVSPVTDEAHRHEGLRALAVVPVWDEGRVIAALKQVAAAQRDGPCPRGDPLGV